MTEMMELESTEVQKSISLYPQTGEWTMMSDMAKTLISSGMLPQNIDTPQKALAVMLKGRELGIPAMQSFTHVYVIEGKPACSSELMLALMARGGVTWEWINDGRGKDKTASIKFSRKDFPDFVSTFSFQDAEKIVKYEKGKPVKATETYTWKQYLPNMLRARAISNGARSFAPDLIGGMSYTVEELIDYDSVNAVEAEVKEVDVKMTKELEVKKRNRALKKRESEFKRLVKAIDSFGIAMGSLDEVESYFAKHHNIEINKNTNDPVLEFSQLDEIDDLEGVIEDLRTLFTDLSKSTKDVVS